MSVSLPPASLLGELPLAEFLAEYWQRRPLYRPGDPGRMQGLFDLAAWRAALHRCEGLKISGRDGQGRRTEQACTPAQALNACEAGATVCISGILDNPVLDRFLAAFAAWLPQAGELSFNCYRSAEGAGFGLHLDDHPVWILQVEGRKRWWYARRPHPFVRGTVSFMGEEAQVRVPWSPLPIARPRDDEFEVVELAPGDVLYLPEGCWHRAAGGAGGSLALTLACSRSTPLDLVQQVLGPRLAALPALTDNLSGWAAPLALQGQGAPELDAALDHAVQELRAAVARLTPAELRAALLAQARRHAAAATRP